MQSRLPNLGTLAGLSAILLWSTTFALARSVAEQVGPVTAGAAVYLLGGLLGLARFACSPAPMARLRGLPPAYLWGCGTLFAVYTVAIYLAVGLARNREQLLEIAMVNYLWPAFTLLFSLVLLQRRASLWLWPGTALALSGVCLVLTQSASVSWATFWAHVWSNPAAYGLALTAAVAWALYSNLTRRWSAPSSAGAVELFLPATGLILLGVRFTLHEPTAWTLRAAAEAGGLAAMTALAYVLWDVAMRRGNLLLVVVCSYFTPLLSTVVSCLYFALTPHPKLWIGCLLLVTGSLLSWHSVANRPAKVA